MMAIAGRFTASQEIIKTRLVKRFFHNQKPLYLYQIRNLFQGVSII